MNIAIAFILSVAIIVAGFLVGGRYEVVATGEGVAYVVDRVTGSVRFCVPSGCEAVDAASPLTSPESDWEITPP